MYVTSNCKFWPVGGFKGEVPLLAGPTLETYDTGLQFLCLRNKHLPITSFRRQGHLIGQAISGNEKRNGDRDEQEDQSFFRYKPPLMDSRSG